MVSTKKDPVLAVLYLSGGNDGLNTVRPKDPSHQRVVPRLPPYPEHR